MVISHKNIVTTNRISMIIRAPDNLSPCSKPVQQCPQRRDVRREIAERLRQAEHARNASIMSWRVGCGEKLTAAL